MSFAEPIWLLAGAFVCASLLWLYRRADARRRADLARFAAESLIGHLTRSLSPGRRALKRALVALSVACAAISLARPQWGFVWEETHRKGLDLMLAVDVSKSMLAQDVRPDRLARAKMAVEDLLQKLEGDRVGLVAFAGSAFLQCPLTLDYNAFRQSLEALDVSVIPRGGTDIAAAIRETVTALEGKDEGERILILLTDGEDLEGRALEAARQAGAGGLKVFTVGVGSSSGELVPVPDGKGGTAFARDRDGQFVKSRLDESMLSQIAEATGGRYEPLGIGSLGLETIYEKGLAPFARRDLASRMHKVPIERFQWPLALSLLCLVTEPLIGLRRRRRSAGPRSIRANALVTAWNRLARPAATLALVTVFMGGSALGSTRSAERAYLAGDYPHAAEAYGQAVAQNPDSPLLRFNQGAAEYKSGDFNAAAEAFLKALKSDDVDLQQDNYYNLGNAHYRLGQQLKESNCAETSKHWEQAIQSYETAIQLNPADQDAVFNRDLVQRKLEELKQQQQQEQKQDPQQNPQQQQGQQQQQQGSQQQPQDQSGDAQRQDSQAQKDQRGGDGAEAQRVAGEMSRDEARQLLDSLRGDDRKLPAVPCARGGTRALESEPVKDW